ncbi:MAG: hypothetical protein ACYDC3_16945 [Candidatus Binataceae bacterium]
MVQFEFRWREDIVAFVGEFGGMTKGASMTKSKIETAKKTMYVPLSVFRAGKTGLTISCADPRYKFKFGTSPDQLQKLKDKLAELFSALVEGEDSN